MADFDSVLRQCREAIETLSYEERSRAARAISAIFGLYRRTTNAEEAVEMFRRGDTIEAISQKTGLPTRAIRAKLHEAGASVPDKRRNRLKLRDEEIVRRYTAGESSESIAKSLNVCSETIYLRLRAKGVVLRGAKKISDEDSASIAKEYKEGASGASLAKDYGVSTDTVYKHLRRHGVEMKHPESVAVKLSDDAIVERYMSGESAESIAKSLNSYSAAIALRLKARGIVLRGASKISEESSLAIARKYEEGVPVISLAQEYGVSPEAIRRHLRRHRVKSTKLVPLQRSPKV